MVFIAISPSPYKKNHGQIVNLVNPNSWHNGISMESVFAKFNHLVQLLSSALTPNISINIIQ